ncbi:MAG: hypothetical protein JW726_15640 [Anaerolineales bacterium]|nr:hypothetical protein [Anaerolineales bacterium]
MQSFADWLQQNQRGWRSALVLLMLASTFGPWVLEALAVPEPNPCDSGVRLNQNTCGNPLSGMLIFPWGFLALFGSVARIMSGITSPAKGVGEMVFGLLLILVYVPILSMLVLALRPSPRWRALHKATLFLALAGAFWLAIAGNPVAFWHLWGIWLYILLLGVGIALEFLSQRGRAPSPV